MSAGGAAKARNAAAVVISKKVIGCAAVGALAFLEDAPPARLSSISCAGEADALVEAHEMRRGVDVHAPARRLEHGAQMASVPSPCRWCRRHGRPAAAGARGWPSAREQPLDAVERQVDDLGMQARSAARGPGRCRRRLVGLPARACRRRLRAGTVAGRLSRPAEGVGSRSSVEQAGQRRAQLGARHDHVDHAVLEQIFGALEALRQLLADRLLDDARAGEADDARRARRCGCRRAWRRRR